MEQKMRFGLVLGQLPIMKKNWGQLWGWFFHVFRGKKIIQSKKRIVASTHKMKVRKKIFMV